jgi:hypothetical protein
VVAHSLAAVSVQERTLSTLQTLLAFPGLAERVLDDLGASGRDLRERAASVAERVAVVALSAGSVFGTPVSAVGTD